MATNKLPFTFALLFTLTLTYGIRSSEQRGFSNNVKNSHSVGNQFEEVKAYRPTEPGHSPGIGHNIPPAPSPNPTKNSFGNYFQGVKTASGPSSPGEGHNIPPVPPILGDDTEPITEVCLELSTCKSGTLFPQENFDAQISRRI